ncbi:Aps3 protein [Martiniozyma asiatica (nom. inval.)]|nr:Aps3 protein [Martiniozyma asiatica]
MIHSVLIFNNEGLPRLVRFYTETLVDKQQLLLKQIHSLLSQRSESHSSFLSTPPILEEYGDVHIIYRHYATLYFVFIVDSNESHLAILDLIQVFVQVLNRCFKDVCELDLVFHWQVLQIALSEMIQGGMVIETSINKIFTAIDAMNQQGGLGTNTDTFFTRWAISR